jgi:hypothetical protein
MTQTRLSRSHKNLAPLSTITTTHVIAEGLCGFSKLTQLTRIHLEGVHEHDWLPSVLDCDEAEHTLCSVFVRSFLGFSTHLSLTGNQADYEVHAFHS